MADRNTLQQLIENIDGRSILILGLGSLGEGVEAARFFSERNARVTVCDDSGSEHLGPALHELQEMNVERVELGAPTDLDWRQNELIVVDQFVAMDHSILQAARSQETIITSEAELFLSLCRAPVVAVTGTTGKSTTAAMIHGMLNQNGISWCGRTNERSLINSLDHIAPHDHVVMSLSSIQLATMPTQQFRAAVLTNFSSNHLDRHMTLDAYRSAKKRIFEGQPSEGIAVLNNDSLTLSEWTTQSAPLTFGTLTISRGCLVGDNSVTLIDENGSNQIQLPKTSGYQWKHNRMNAAAAAACCLGLGTDSWAIADGIHRFNFLPDRLESLGSVEGRVFVCDSFSTTPDAVLAGLKTCHEPTWAIVGGLDVGVDIAGLAHGLTDLAEGIAVIGESAVALELAVRKSGSEIPVQKANSLTGAVSWCFSQSQDGDAILFSPGFSPGKMFHSCVERSHRFRQAFETLGDFPTPEDTIDI